MSNQTIIDRHQAEWDKSADMLIAGLSRLASLTGSPVRRKRYLEMLSEMRRYSVKPITRDSPLTSFTNSGGSEEPFDNALSVGGSA